MKIKHVVLILFCYFFSSNALFSQSYVIEGYAFETGNRGFLNQVLVIVTDKATGSPIGSSYSDQSGTWTLDVPGPGTYTLSATKNMFNSFDSEVEVKEGVFKTFSKQEMKRSPGYRFEITLAEKKQSFNQPTNAIRGALIEVYNNTTKEPEMVLEDYEHPEFEVDLLQGNHYTILIRKEGYLAKRMEAYVNVEGCILCFEGVGEIQPGVSDNLTDNNETGVLLANVELDSIFTGKKIQINDIYYDLNKWNITKPAREELDKVATLLRDNPNVKIELGSHTDSRGKNDYNLELSQKRAASAVDYLKAKAEVSSDRIISRGYGETELANNCADGVDCSEEMHAQNRRTELKILTIKKQEVFKTLAAMKQIEFMDELLLEIAEEGQIKVVGNDTIKSAPKPVIEEKQVEKPNKKKKSGKKQMPNKKVRKDNTSMETVEKPIQEVIPTSEGVVNGYKIVAKETKEALPLDDDLYKRHADLFELVDEDGIYHYLFGNFGSDQECYNFHKTVKAMYPNSYVVMYKDGKILK